MRPIQKPCVGEVTADGHRIEKRYQPYTQAKYPLISALGQYCCYCEVRENTPASIDIEHIKPRSKYQHLATAWINLVLSCNTCNSIEKKAKVANFTNTMFPLRDHTFQAIKYGAFGLVSVNPDLSPQDQERAQNLIDLVGLNKRPGSPEFKPSDYRWQNRKETWEIAMRTLGHFERGTVVAETVLDLASSRGFWSIWRSVFHAHPAVVAGLDAWVGTRVPIVS